MKVNELKEAITGLTKAEWVDLSSWVANEERERRSTLETKLEAQIDTIRQLRADNVIESPEGDVPEYKNGLVYLPGERVSFEEDIFIGKEGGPIKTNPTDTTRWEHYSEPEMAEPEIEVIYNPNTGASGGEVSVEVPDGE